MPPGKKHPVHKKRFQKKKKTVPEFGNQTYIEIAEGTDLFFAADFTKKVFLQKIETIKEQRKIMFCLFCKLEGFTFIFFGGETSFGIECFFIAGVGVSMLLSALFFLSLPWLSQQPRKLNTNFYTA